jgi:excisionase family DNA binding protein
MHSRINKLAMGPLQAEGLSPTEAGLVGGFGRSKVFQLIADGSLPAKKIGKKTIVLRADLMAFLENLPRAGEAA